MLEGGYGGVAGHGLEPVAATHCLDEVDLARPGVGFFELAGRTALVDGRSSTHGAVS